MGKLEVLSFKPDLFSHVVLTWYHCAAPCLLIDGVNSLDPIFKEVSDSPFYCFVV
jgi:hypothetical protein